MVAVNSPRSDPRKRQSPPKTALTASQIIHAIQREEPELFSPYDAREIAEAVLAKGVPAAANAEVWEFWCRMHGRDFKPRETDEQKNEQRRQERAERAAANRAAAKAARSDTVRKGLVEIDASFVMMDGRRLGDWTIGELRKVGGVFGFILDKAGTTDDARTVDEVMAKPADWKKANTAG